MSFRGEDSCDVFGGRYDLIQKGKVPFPSLSISLYVLLCNNKNAPKKIHRYASGGH